MATLVEEQRIRKLAKKLDKELAKIYGTRMGFFLCVSPFYNDDAIADYIGNTERESAIEWMKETVQRFETGQTISASQGEA